jgi:isopenicillin-N epimerase
MYSLRDLFLLDPDVVYLNHGSFGACPKPVFETYQQWQLELERQPVEFLGRRSTQLLADARAALARYLKAAPDEVVYFTNPTTAINMVARSMDLKPGDEILTTNHEYGAMDRTWRFICSRTRARYIHTSTQLPVSNPEDFVEQFWEGVNKHTRAIFISHITSPTALILPVESICQKARQQGLLCIVDGAHAPGQIPVDLPALGADIYTGACHKWLMSPKGAAFLYARKEIQKMLSPLVVSWGYESEFPSESQFIDYHEWQGTRDLAAFLSVPAAIEFQEKYNWAEVRQECHRLAVITNARINSLTGLPSISSNLSTHASISYTWFQQMFSASLPDWIDPIKFKTRLYAEFRIEVPILSWNNQIYIRVSIQGYNTFEDINALLTALQKLL